MTTVPDAARRTVGLAVFESGLIVGTVVASAWLRFGEGVWDLFRVGHAAPRVLLVAFVCQLCLYYADVYDLRIVADRRVLFVRTVQALGIASFLLAAIYFWFPALVIGDGVFLTTVFLLIALVIGWRGVFEWLSRRVGPRERLLIVGTSSGAVDLARELFARRQELGVEIVGFVDADPEKVGAPVINPGVVGTVTDIPAIIRDRQVDRVVVSLVDARGKLPMDELLGMKLDGVSFDHLASVYEEYTGKIAVDNLRPSWLIFSSGFRKARWLMAVKRIIDVCAAAVGLVVGASLMVVIAVLVKLTSEGPVLYHQRRVGQHGRVFVVHKFRSMYRDAEAVTGAVWAEKNDQRVTPVGRFLRRARLDELPQLWNVLRGDMSLVGPRPERPEIVQQLTDQIPFYGLRHVGRPGLTGWAQVRYTYGATVEDALEKLQYDLYYLKNLSVTFDLFIVFSTIKIVMLRRGAQ